MLERKGCFDKKGGKKKKKKEQKKKEQKKRRKLRSESERVLSASSFST